MAFRISSLICWMVGLGPSRLILSNQISYSGTKWLLPLLFDVDLFWRHSLEFNFFIFILKSLHFNSFPSAIRLQKLEHNCLLMHLFTIVNIWFAACLLFVARVQLRYNLFVPSSRSVDWNHNGPRNRIARGSANIVSKFGNRHWGSVLLGNEAWTRKYINELILFQPYN